LLSADDIQGEDFKSSQIMSGWSAVTTVTNTIYFWKSMTLICFLLENGTLHGFGMRSS
jgi:hypothetical protein